MNSSFEIAPCVQSYAYTGNGVTYVPHFRNQSVFIGPGYPKKNKKLWTESELQKAGAKRKVTMLWPRGTTGVVNDRNL